MCSIQPQIKWESNVYRSEISHCNLYHFSVLKFQQYVIIGPNYHAIYHTEFNNNMFIFVFYVKPQYESIMFIFLFYLKLEYDSVMVWTISCCDCSHSLTLQYIPRNMHMVFALLCFVGVIHWLIFPYPSGLLHWHCGNLTIAPVPAKQPWWIWINTSCEFIMNDRITTTKQSTTKPCAYFLGYTVYVLSMCVNPLVSWPMTAGLL